MQHRGGDCAEVSDVGPGAPEALPAQLADGDQMVERLSAEADALRDKIANLEVALRSARQIGAAIGILMATLKVSQDEAFALLSYSSQTLHRKLRDIADQVVFTGALPTASPASEPNRPDAARTVVDAAERPAS